VTGSFQISDLQIESYPIPAEGKRLLKGLAVYEILAFIETVPMHRTDCNLKVLEVDISKPLSVGDVEVNTSTDAKTAVEKALKDCQKSGIVGSMQEVSVTLKEKPQSEGAAKKPKPGKNNSADATEVYKEEE
jgi:hypothetical protein